MKFTLGPKSRLFVAYALGSFVGFAIVQPILWSLKDSYDKKKDLPPPKYQ